VLPVPKNRIAGQAARTFGHSRARIGAAKGARNAIAATQRQNARLTGET